MKLKLFIALLILLIIQIINAHSHDDAHEYEHKEDNEFVISTNDNEHNHETCNDPSHNHHHDHEHDHDEEHDHEHHHHHHNHFHSHDHDHEHNHENCNDPSHDHDHHHHHHHGEGGTCKAHNHHDEIKILETIKGKYGTLSVVDHGPRNLLLLKCDNSFLGSMSTHHDDSASRSSIIMAGTSFINTEAKKALLIGLGIGSIPRIMNRFIDPKLHIDALELDENIVKLAKKYFQFDDKKNHVIISEAREFLFKYDNKYDLIFHDIHTAGVSTAHLLTKEVFVRIRDVLLNDKGVLAVNFLGAHKGKLQRGSIALANTLRNVFKYVEIYFDGNPDQSEIGNIIFHCSMYPLDFQQTERAQKLPFRIKGVLLDSVQWKLKLQDKDIKMMIVDKNHEQLVKLQEPVIKETWELAKQAFLPADFKEK